MTAEGLLELQRAVNRAIFSIQVAAVGAALALQWLETGEDISAAANFQIDATHEANIRGEPQWGVPEILAVEELFGVRHKEGEDIATGYDGG